MIQIEHWQDLADKLIHDDDTAIIVSDDQDLSNQKALQVQLQQLGQPVGQVRKTLIKNHIKRQLKTEPLKLSNWFNRHQDNQSAKKTEKLVSDKPAYQYKQIKNELTFFGESFLEGFLGFYGLEVHSALGRYEHHLHVLEIQELGQAEKEYYLATSQNGQIKLATEPLPNQRIAEEQLDKFYKREPEHTQIEQVQLRSLKDDGKEK